MSAVFLSCTVGPPPPPPSRLSISSAAPSAAPPSPPLMYHDLSAPLLTTVGAELMAAAKGALACALSCQCRSSVRQAACALAAATHLRVQRRAAIPSHNLLFNRALRAANHAVPHPKRHVVLRVLILAHKRAGAHAQLEALAEVTPRPRSVSTAAWRRSSGSRRRRAPGSRCRCARSRSSAGISVAGRQPPGRQSSASCPPSAAASTCAAAAA